MDLSATLTQLTRKLCSPTLDSCQVHIQRLKDYRVVVEASRLGESIQGGGIARTLLAAYLKALGEFGEGLICLREDHNNRSGLAAGLLFSPAVDRAKAELIERDAFLFHYRQVLPFLERRALSNSNVAYRMATALPDWHGFLVTDGACASGKNPCLLFGTAADRSEKLALQRAHHEYQTIARVHALRPTRCAELADSPSVDAAPDRHHLASRDPRNRERFQTLCASLGSTHSHRPPLHGSWEIESVPSPIRSLVYARAKHSQLTPLVFDQPEDPTGDRPLFHPFW